jgi:putative ABC transport system permease protein
VLPESFRFFSDFDVWVPLALDPQRELTGPFFSFQPTIARLRPGVTPKQAETELNGLLQRYETTRPEKRPEFAARQPRLVPLQEHFLGDTRRPMLVLLGAVALVLLIACANVANLLLARAVTRQRELAIRAALGASRLRLTRQLLTECLLLAASGGVVGLLLAYWLTGLLGSLDLADTVGQVARVTALKIDLRVFGFAMLVSLATGLLFGLLPTLRLSRPNLNKSLREGAHGSKSQGRGLRGALLVSEVAIAVVLLSGAGLLMRSFAKLMEVDPGYRPEDLLTAQLRLPPRYDGEAMRSQFYDQLLQRVAALPGVESVGATSQLPLTRYNMGGTLRVMDRAAETGKREVSAPITAVSSDYFRTMGIGLRAGRFFDESEAPGTASVTLLSETLARKLFPESDPVGKRIFVAGSGAEWTTVIGVVDEIRHQGLDQAIEEVAYLNIQQLPRPMMALVLRCSLSPLSLAPSLRQAVTEMDPALPIFDVMTMKARLAKSVAGRRFNLLLLGTFAALALLLAGVGVYGVIAYLVSDRTREVGIRMALGAQCRDVQRLVLRQGLTLAGLGIGIGLPGALAATQLLRSLLFGISPIDPVTYLVIPLLVLGVAGLACWVPARRAARVDPMVALRCE